MSQTTQTKERTMRTPSQAYEMLKNINPDIIKITKNSDYDTDNDVIIDILVDDENINVVNLTIPNISWDGITEYPESIKEETEVWVDAVWPRDYGKPARFTDEDPEAEDFDHNDTDSWTEIDDPTNIIRGYTPKPKGSYKWIDNSITGWKYAQVRASSITDNNDLSKDISPIEVDTKITYRLLNPTETVKEGDEWRYTDRETIDPNDSNYWNKAISEGVIRIGRRLSDSSKEFDLPGGVYLSTNGFVRRPIITSVVKNSVSIEAGDGYRIIEEEEPLIKGVDQFTVSETSPDWQTTNQHRIETDTRLTYRRKL